MLECSGPQIRVLPLKPQPAQHLRKQCEKHVDITKPQISEKPEAQCSKHSQNNILHPYYFGRHDAWLCMLSIQKRGTVEDARFMAFKRVWRHRPLLWLLQVPSVMSRSVANSGIGSV